MGIELELERGSVEGKMSSKHSNSHSFDEVAGCYVAGVLVSKYKSTRTGLVVCLARVKSPLVNGYFCLGEISITGDERTICGRENGCIREVKEHVFVVTTT